MSLRHEYNWYFEIKKISLYIKYRIFWKYSNGYPYPRIKKLRERYCDEKKMIKQDKNEPIIIIRKPLLLQIKTFYWLVLVI